MQAKTIVDKEPAHVNSFTHKFKNTFYQPLKEKCISDMVRIGSIKIFHLSKLWKAKLFIL